MLSLLESIKMVNLTWLLLWGILPLYCISFVFNLNPERKEGEKLGISRGIQLYFLPCSLQYNDFVTESLSYCYSLFSFSFFISVDLEEVVSLFFSGILSLTLYWTISQFYFNEKYNRLRGIKKTWCILR